MIGATVVETRFRLEARETRRQIVLDDGIGVRADSERDRFAGDSHRPSTAILVEVDLSPIGAGRLPFEVGQLLFSAGPQPIEVPSQLAQSQP